MKPNLLLTYLLVAGAGYYAYYVYQQRQKALAIQSAVESLPYFI